MSYPDRQTRRNPEPNTGSLRPNWSSFGAGNSGSGQWADDVQFEHSGLNARRPTVGEMIDQFLAMTDEDRVSFLSIVGSMGHQVPSQTNRPVQAYRSSTKSSSKTQESSGRVPIRTEPLPSGYTSDPKTGQIYRAQNPRERSEEFLQLEGEYEELRTELAQLMQENKFVFDIGSKETLDQDNNVLKEEDLPPRINEIRKKLGPAKDRIRQYKADHRDEFTPPPTKGGKRARGRGVPVIRGRSDPG
jgi:hypothetical protein